MTVNGIDRDGTPIVLQQPLVGIRRLYGGPVSHATVLTTPGPSQNSPFFICIWNGGADAAVSLVSVDALEDKDTVRPCLVVSGTEAVSCWFFLSVSSLLWRAVLVCVATCFH